MSWRNLTHLFYLEQYQINNPAYGIGLDPKNSGGPLMSKFTVWSSNPGMVLGNYDEQNGGEGSLAKHYVLGDNCFHSAFGGFDAAAQDVQAAIAKAARQLPPNMPSPPTYQKVNPADSPIIFLAMSSPTLPMSDVDNYAENLLAEQISKINGVAQVGVFGAQPYAVRIQVDPNKLAAYGLGIDQVEQAVERAT